jgi:hypothetical protein
MLEEEHLRAIKTWNFDVTKEIPLEGRWQWESVGQPEMCEREMAVQTDNVTAL